MSGRSHIAMGIAAAAVVSACRVTLPVPEARVRRGPAVARPVTKVLALPSVCRYDLCTGGQRFAVAMKSRMALEFAGYRIIDSERINLFLGNRTERDRRALASEVGQVTVRGATWADATPAQKHVLLRKMGIDAILKTAIDFGPTGGAAGDRLVTVRLELVTPDGQRLRWSSRCAVSAAGPSGFDKAIELATECSIQSAARVGVF